MNMMTLEEALMIKEAINKKAEIDAVVKSKFQRMNPSWMNILAGLTESWCSVTKKTCLTRHDLERLEQMYRTDWTTSGKKDQRAWKNMIQCQKILENWNDSAYDMVGDGGDEATENR